MSITKQLISVTCSLILCTSLLADTKPEVIRLWPDGAPNDSGLKEPERINETGRVVNVTDPDISVFPAKNPNGLAVILCPGGGYTHLAIHHEGLNMADWYNSLGITVAVLKYRMPNGNLEVPLSDACQAVRILRSRASEWGIKKVGIQGCSAGGNLACMACCYADTESKPDFQILLYPYTSDFNKRGTAGESLDDCTEYATSGVPPTIIFHSSDDKTVPVAHSVLYYLALVDKKVPASLHIYPSGGHGWGFRDRFEFKRQWTEELEKWLRVQADSK